MWKPARKKSRVRSLLFKRGLLNAASTFNNEFLQRVSRPISIRRASFAKHFAQPLLLKFYSIEIKWKAWRPVLVDRVSVVRGMFRAAFVAN